MAKTCTADNCSFPVFGGRYCKRHQYLRTDKNFTSLKRKSMKPAFKPSGEKILFDTILATRPHKSQLSGKKINNPDHKNCAHLWPKGKYPEFRLLDINICILTFEEHFLFDQGTAEQRQKYARENNCDWNVIERLKQTVL